MDPVTQLDVAGRRRSPATLPGYHTGRAPRNMGRTYPADPPRVEGVVAVMRQAGEAFESSDPHDTIRTMAVTGSYSAIVNASVEILKAAAGNRLIGLLPHRRPHADQVFAAVQSGGGLTVKQFVLLNGCYVLEGRLEHASPDVSADEIRVAVERLRTALRDLIATVVMWLESYGVSFRDNGSPPP